MTDGVGRLSDKVALITGGSSGIGRATAELFAREGARAVIIVDHDAEAAAATISALTATGCAAWFVEADVTNTEAPDDTVTATVEKFGRLDVIMTSAGISVGQSLPRTTPEDWERVFAVNVTGTYLWLRAAIPVMVNQGAGSVVTVASQLAINGGRNNAAYIASKGAVIALTRTTANDFAAHGVRVNAILPGATETPLLDTSFGRLADPESARQRSLSRHPMGRFGRPEEIAQAALYLASDESTFTTGTEIRVDGGWIAG